MPNHLLILTEEKSGPALAQYIALRAPRLDVRILLDRPALERTCEDLFAASAASNPRIRLIAFCCPFIVPPALIPRLGLVAYNIHPGTPDYPGVHPDAFAHKDGVRVWGATAHELIGEIDAGMIVARADNDVPPDVDRIGLADLGFACAVDLFRLIADFCLRSDEAIPGLKGAQWSGKRRSMADYRALLMV